MASSEALKAFDPPGCWPLRSGGERVSLRWSRWAAIDEADVAGGEKKIEAVSRSPRRGEHLWVSEDHDDALEQ
jgi:hypothetical protein